MEPNDRPQAEVVTTKTGTPETEVLEESAEFFAELATHDEYAEPTTEPEPVRTEGVASGATDAQPQPVAPPTAAVPDLPAPAPVQQSSATPPVNPEAAPSTPEQPTPASAAAPEPQPAPTPVEPVDFEKHRAEVLPKLETLYGLSETEAEELRIEPEKALPKLAARLHYEVTAAAFNAVMSSLPQFVERTMQTR
jgi:hypothetical protein